MATYVDASHNMLFRLDHDPWMEDLAKSGDADVTGYQEAEGGEQRAVLKEFCAANNRGLYHPASSGNPISWRKDVFSVVRINRKPVQGVVTAHLGALALGIDAEFNPARDFTWVGLNHKGTGKKILRVNVHPLAGGTKPESNPDNTDSNELSAYKDWGIGQYWLDVLSFVAGQMSLQDPGPRTMTNLWDVVSLGGDYNAAMDNFARWYYPAPLLEGLFEHDKNLRGLDHLQHAFGSDVQVTRRWAEAGNTDHSIHFVERRFVDVPDFQRQR
jgi:hypothetical protein